jgi:hypothetical protein
VTSQMGSNMLDTFVEQQADYPNNAAEQTAMKTAAFQRWLAYLLLKGSDRTKYGSLLMGFVSQFSLGNDQYPKDLTTATDVLSNHKFDPSFFETQKKNR